MNLFDNVEIFIKSLTLVDIIFFVAIISLLILIVTLIYFIKINKPEVFDTNSSGGMGGNKDSDEIKTPWSLLREAAKKYRIREKFDKQMLIDIKDMAELYLDALSYPKAKSELIPLNDELSVPVFLEIKKIHLQQIYKIKTLI